MTGTIAAAAPIVVVQRHALFSRLEARLSRRVARGIGDLVGNDARRGRTFLAKLGAFR